MDVFDLKDPLAAYRPYFVHGNQVPVTNRSRWMSLEQFVLVGELIAAIAVVVSLVYLAHQVRHGTSVNSAHARHAISQFALDFSMFKAEHADRLTRVTTESDLGAGDLTFRWWNHMMIFLHAETYFHHYELGLMPKNHWSSYVRYVQGYVSTPGVGDFWVDVGPAFSLDFSKWVDGLLRDEGILPSPGAAL